MQSNSESPSDKPYTKRGKRLSSFTEFLIPGTCARSTNSRFTCAECPECSEHGRSCPRSTDHDGCVCPRGPEHDAAGRPVRVHVCVRVSLVIVSCLAVISVLLTVVCFTMLMQLQRSPRKTLHHHANVTSLCVPCGSLRLSTGEENALLAGMKRHLDPRTGRYVCCSNSRMDAGQMLNRVGINTDSLRPGCQ